MVVSMSTGSKTRFLSSWLFCAGAATGVSSNVGKNRTNKHPRRVDPEVDSHRAGLRNCPEENIMPGQIFVFTVASKKAVPST